MPLPQPLPTATPSLNSMLPHALPADPESRAMLVAARRMAIHGLQDASAAMLVMRVFGLRFRKVLVLLRAFMLESSHMAQQPIMVAPCCTPRMTAQEHALIEAIRCAGRDPARASAHIRRLTGATHGDALLATARALAGAVSPWAVE